MRMLHDGGVPCAGVYPAFEDAHTMPGRFDHGWFASQAGRAVKVLDPQRIGPILWTPMAVIWLGRDPAEQAKSMLKLAALGMPGVRQDWQARRAMMASIVRDTAAGVQLFKNATGHSPLRLSFEDLLPAPERTTRKLFYFLRDFAGVEIDEAAARRAIIPRSPACLKGFLEESLLLSKATAR